LLKYEKAINYNKKQQKSVNIAFKKELI